LLWLGLLKLYACLLQNVLELVTLSFEPFLKVYENLTDFKFVSESSC
jgi:hypothetical protein